MANLQSVSGPNSTSPSQHPNGIVGATSTSPAVFPSGIIASQAAAIQTASTALTKDSARVQVFNLSGAATATLPQTGIVAGDTFEFVNTSSSFVLTINAAGGSAVSTLSNGKLRMIALIATPSAASDWKMLDGSIVSSSSNGLMPFSLSALDDATATRMGLKVYSHGTSYNGGNAPTVTLSLGGGTLSSVAISSFIPYQMADGTWRMKFNIRALISSTARTIVGLSVNGISFPPTDQAVAGNNAGAIAVTYAVAYSAGNTIGMGHPSAVTDNALFSGDIVLASKPTWAY